MTEFIRNGFKNKRLVRLNRCRVFLQVYTLADVCAGDGRKLISDIMHGRNPMKGSSRLQWPNQGQLPQSDWKLWRSALQKCFLLRRTHLVFTNHSVNGSYPLPLTGHAGIMWRTIVPTSAKAVNGAGSPTLTRVHYYGHPSHRTCFMTPSLPVVSRLSGGLRMDILPSRAGRDKRM